LLNIPTVEKFWTPESEQQRRADEEIRDFEDEVFSGDTEVPNEKHYTNEVVPEGLISTHDLAVSNPALPDQIYKWYSAAIQRRDRQPLEEGRFIAHFFEGLSFDETFAFGNLEKGFLLGFLKYGVFTPTHFAPKTMRGGYELIKTLGESLDVPAVMSVTQDLTETISKLQAWHKVDMSFLAMFRDQLEQKDVVYNSHPDVRNLMMGLVAEYLAESKAKETSVDY
jgi:hypothetical protein